MPQLQDNLFRKIESFHNKAEIFIEQEQFSNAIKEYQKAWNTLSEPKQLWEAALWIKVGQAECFLALDEYEKAKEKLLDGILCAGALNNPLVHLLLGICHFELNNTQKAREEFQIAYKLEGNDIFQESDKVYQDFFFTQAKNEQ
jgi:tetratricopeptide (TPR) repeat protein